MAKKFVDEIHLLNWKKHKDLTVKINGRHFMAIGPNGIGKSSVFQALLRLLGGMKKLPDEITTLSDETIKPTTQISTVLVNNGDKYVVEEKFNKDGKGRVRFRKLNSNGGSDDLTPALERIKEIFGNVVDLTPLMNMAGDKQFEFLQKAMALDLSSYKVKRKYLFDDRQLNNREIKSIEAKFNAPEYHVPQADIDQYKEEKDVQSILKKKVDLLPLRMKVQQFEQDKRTDAMYAQQIKSIDDQIKKLQQQRENIVQQKGKLNVSQQDFIRINGELSDAEKKNKLVDEELEEVGDHNKKVRFISSYLKENEILQEKRKKSEALTADIAELDKSLRDALLQLNLSAVYDGLELRYKLNEQNEPEQVGLFLNNLAFNKLQLSYGEMIKALIKLSCFLNPDGLNFVWIEDWSLLDQHNQEDLLAFAAENENVQFGIEKVDNTKEIILDFIQHK